MDIVGRDHELAMVERLLDERQAGPLAVIIEGDAGIGPLQSAEPNGATQA